MLIYTVAKVLPIVVIDLWYENNISGTKCFNEEGMLKLIKIDL
jgi:hypothetical protein